MPLMQKEGGEKKHEKGMEWGGNWIRRKKENMKLVKLAPLKVLIFPNIEHINLSRRCEWFWCNMGGSQSASNQRNWKLGFWAKNIEKRNKGLRNRDKN